MHPPGIIQRTLTVGGAAIGAAALVGALAVAMKGIVPVPSSAATDPSLARTLDAIRATTRHSPSPNMDLRRLVGWHAPRIPKFHPPAPQPPVVVTATAPPTFVAAPATQPPATVAPVAHARASAGDDGQQGGHDD